MNEFKTCPGLWVRLTPASVGLDTVATWRLVGVDVADCQCVTAANGAFIVNPQREGIFVGVALDGVALDGIKLNDFKIVCEAKSGGSVWSILNPLPWIASNLPSAATLSKAASGAFLAVAILLTAQRGCDWPTPVPPGPTPVPVDPPKPPEPKPSAPIPADKLRVLVVYEATAGAPQLTAKQLDELYGAELWEFLAANCDRADGKAEFRIWDKDIALAGASEVWRQAMGRTRASVPWLIVSNGKTGFEGPLPDGGILTKIKEYGK